MYKLVFKRSIDFAISILVIILISPIMFLVLIFLLLFNNEKLLFSQVRPGKNGNLFKVVKFKTMNDAKDNLGRLKPDKERLTPIGRFIRSTSLDELPQLFNVLKGDMSLIGPRPLLIKYLPLYTAQQARRHEVRPGITGWAQVNGRNAISWKQKFELDIYYVDNLSFKLDMKILWMTIVNVIKRKGINQQGQATIEAFNGNN